MSADKSHRTSSFLIVRDGVNSDWVVIWDTVEITVGRSDDQDIVVRDAAVSRKHCVFRHKREAFTLEDLRSALGTLVNGEPIKVHDLVSGDVVEIGSMKIKFGQTESPVKPGANVRFASQLKSFGSVPDDASGRTMMAIDLSDEFAGVPTLAKQVAKARAVSMDGSLEESDAPPDLVAPGDPGFDLGAPPGVRNLDAALADFTDGLGPIAAAPLRSGPLAAGAAPTAATGDVRVQLVLEVAGPAAQVETLVAAIREKPIQVYPLTLCVKDPRRG
jgi:predicted component of type VI protein secretion system